LLRDSRLPYAPINVVVSGHKYGNELIVAFFHLTVVNRNASYAPLE